MDLSDKRFTELRALSKAITIQNNILEQSKQKDINFQLGVQKVSEPFLKDVIKKEDEILEKLNDKTNVETKTADVEALIDLDDVKQPPSYSESADKLYLININFETKPGLDISITPMPSTVKLYNSKDELNGITINNTSFYYYRIAVSNKIKIHQEDNTNNNYELTSGLKLLLEGKGTLKKHVNHITQLDLDNYLSIIKLSNVDINKIEYLTTLSTVGIGKGKTGKGIDISDDDEDDLPDNPLLLLSELRKLLAAKLSGHNNVYNSVKSILNKLLLIKKN